MPLYSVTKYVIRRYSTIPGFKPGIVEYLSRSGTRNEWVTDFFQASQFHTDPFMFSEIRKIINKGDGHIVAVRITAETDS